jgi:hypothetical protein
MSAYRIFEQHVISMKVLKTHTHTHTPTHRVIMEPEGSLLSPVNSNQRQLGPFRISPYFHLALSTHRRTLPRYISSAGRSLRNCTKNSPSISCFTHRTYRGTNVMKLTLRTAVRHICIFIHSTLENLQ